MITEYKIKRCAYLNTLSLEEAFVRNGYKDTKFLQNKFLGITNGGQFCYEVMYFEEECEGNAYTKVFIDLDHNDMPIGDW